MEFKPAKRREPVPPGDIVCGLVVFRERNRTFEVFTYSGGETYDIEADRILTSRQFADWVWQLQSKPWMTGQHFADFFRCLSEFIYRQWDQFPQVFYEVTEQGGMDRV